jgi:hypothetical protein
MAMSRIPNVVYDILSCSEKSESMEYVKREIRNANYIFDVDHSLTKGRQPMYMRKTNNIDHLIVRGSSI